MVFFYLIENLSLKRKASSNNPTYLWHLRLDHINLKKIDILVKEGLLSSLTIQPLPACTSCLKGKITKRLFLAKENRSKYVLELIHIDVCGPLNIRAKGSFEYFITFIDDYSRYEYVYLLHRKSEDLKSSKNFAPGIPQ